MLKIDELLTELVDYPWFSAAGQECNEAKVASNFSEAVDGFWDGWGPKSSDIWLSHSHELERMARTVISDEVITTIFDRVGEQLAEPIGRGISAYFDKMHANDPAYDESGIFAAISYDVMVTIQQDIGWALVEKEINRAGFFSHLLKWYRIGRWPCLWIYGEPPKGEIVVM